jgi:CBS domain-containing protein
MKKVKDLLAGKKGEVRTVSSKTSVFDALQLMVSQEIGALMVTNQAGAIVGIITERDYARKIILKGRKSPETEVQEVMTPQDKMITVTPETLVSDCMVLITGKRIRHLPVYEGERLVGIVSIGDVLKSIIADQESLINQLSDYIAYKW